MANDLRDEAKDISKSLNEIVQSKSGAIKLYNILNDRTDPAIINSVTAEYKILTGNDLLSDIETILQSNFIAKFLTNMFLNPLMHSPKKTTKIINHFWQGESYDVERNGSIITITSQDKQTRQLNLGQLLRYLKTTDARREFVKKLESLPGEILMDIAAEQSSLRILNDEADFVNMGERREYYDPNIDSISIYADSSVQTIVHELGHALDYVYAKGRNQSSANLDKNFGKIFNAEIKKYEEKGKKRFEENKSDDVYTYATKDKQEMFAECYSLLMLGYCESYNVITENFPKTLECVKELITATRKRTHGRRAIIKQYR